MIGKSLIGIAIGLMTLFSLPASAGDGSYGGLCWLAGNCPQSQYHLHVACNESWRASEAHRTQGCKLHKINYDRSGNGIPWCFYDVYCDRGEWWQRASKKGIAPIDHLSYFRRCAENVRKIEQQCTAVTDAQIQEQIDAQW